ncbi:MAG TPA: hypothetical protein VKD71_00640 [Gemmataceae bacterium]|nr:hypothetical protein [Gemmataceae bacterium]
MRLAKLTPETGGFVEGRIVGTDAGNSFEPIRIQGGFLLFAQLRDRRLDGRKSALEFS